MATNQGDRQASVRGQTGTALTYEGDWHALFTLSGIPAGDFNGRLLAFINFKLGTSYTELNGAMYALAVSQGAKSWNELGAITFSVPGTLIGRTQGGATFSGRLTNSLKGSVSAGAVLGGALSFNKALGGNVPGGATFTSALTGAGGVMPTGASGIWYAKDYDTTKKAVPNTIAAGSPISAASRWNTEVLDSSEWGSGTGVTNSTVSLTGPTGTTISAQRMVAAGDWFRDCVVALPSANYVLCFDYITQAGSSQSFKAQNFNNSGQSQTLTATTSWQRGAVPMTGSAAPIFISPDRATGVDLIIANVMIALGTADPGRETLEGHAYFDKLGLSKTTNPAAGVLDMSGGGSGLARFAADITPSSGFTCGAMVSRVSSSDTGEMPILSKKEAFADFSVMIEEGANTAAGYLGGTLQKFKSVWDSNGSGWHLITHCYDGANYEMYLDDARVYKAAYSSGAVTMRNMILAGLSQLGGGFTSSHQFNSWFLYPTALTQTQIQTQVYPALVSRLVADGQTYSRAPLLWLEGDSYTANGLYAAAAAASITRKYFGANTAQGGTALPSMATRFSTYPATGVPSAWTSTKVWSLLDGANDLMAYGGSTNQQLADSFCAQLFAIADTVRGSGWKVVLGTVLPIDGVANYNPVRALVNTQIRASVGTHCDAVADYASDAQMGADTAHTDFPANWSDSVHPSAAGDARMAVFFAAAVNSIP